MGRAADPISALTALLVARRRARALVPVLLRAAAASRARLRRAQGDPRHPRGRRAAHAHRDLAAAAPHARLDEGLSVVARGRRPRHVPAEALQLHRPAAAALGAAALPADAADRRGRGARSAALRARPRCRSASRRPRSPTRAVSRRRPRSERAGELSRSTERKLKSRLKVQSSSQVACTATTTSSFNFESSASRAASCSASFFALPVAVPESPR